METFGSIPELAATAHHITTVQAKLDQLAKVKDDSWTQLLTATARLYHTGALGTDDLARLSGEMRTSYGTGYTKLWETHVPVALGALRYMATQLPNGPAGSWQGTFPLTHNAVTPPRGTSVVYVIFNAQNEPVYVGSTHAFRERMRRHRKDKGASMHSWTAYPCRDRAHAYEMERDLLRQYKLRLNRQGAKAA